MANAKKSSSKSKAAADKKSTQPTKQTGKLTKAQKEEKEKQDAAPVVAGVAQTHKVRPDQPFGTQQVLPPTAAPASQQVLVKHKPTGRVFAAWPVDARELVTHPDQEHAYATPDDAEEWIRPTAGPLGAGMPQVAPKDSTSPTGVDPVDTRDMPVGRGLTADQAKAVLEDKSKSDLQTLATRVGVNPDQPKSKLVAALHPHAQAGTLNLNPPASLVPGPANPNPKVGA